MIAYFTVIVGNLFCEEGDHLEAMVRVNGVRALQCVNCGEFLWSED